MQRICLSVLAAFAFWMGGSPCCHAAYRFAYADVLDPQFFPIIPWDPLHGWDGKARERRLNGLESIKECQFNFAGFVLPGDLRQCEKVGLAAILLPAVDPLVPSNDRKHWRNLSDDEIDARIKAQVRSAHGSAAVAGFFIMDEPSVKDFPALGKAVAAVRKYAPHKFAYINLFPDYATLGAPDTSQLGTSSYTEYLERFVVEVQPQILSYDNYMVQFSDDLRHSDVAGSYFRNMAEVRRVGQKYHLPCLQIVASNQLRPAHPIPTSANLALQAYTTLAAGFRGVTWYTYYARGYKYSPIDITGRRTMTWPCLQEINRQVAALAPVLSRLASTGIYFTAPLPTNGLAALPGEIIEKLTTSVPMMVGEFKGTNERYAMLVNLSLERTANFTFAAKNTAARIEEISAVDGKPRVFSPGKDGMWLPPGNGLLLRVKNAD
jgi:hypothetical protein